MKQAIAIILTFLTLASIAVPSFGEDTENVELARAKIVQDQLSEGVNIAGGVKAAVTEFFLGQGRLPSDNSEAGLSAPYKIKGRYVLSVSVSSGVISIEYGGASAPEIAGRIVELVPEESERGLSWKCVGPYISRQYLPGACQQ